MNDVPHQETVDSEIIDRARKVRVLILDIDGVLTDGRIVYSPYGEELKFFDVQDGLGIVLLRRAGIESVIVTARRSRIVKSRCKDLAIRYLYYGYPNKLIPFKKIVKRFRVMPEEVCFVGDDLIDLPILNRVGLAVTVPNAAEDVRAHAHYVTARPGGRGAVREICDIIMKSQNKWNLVTSLFFK